MADAETHDRTWARSVVWLVIGFIKYFAYGRRHFVPGIKQRAPAVVPVDPAAVGSGSIL